MESASNVTSLKDVVSAQEQRRDKPTGTSKLAVSSTKISKAGKPKAKSSVASPAPNAGTSKAKGTAARTTSDVPKDTGTVVTDSDSKDTGVTLPSLRQEVVHSPKSSLKVDDVSVSQSVAASSRVNGVDEDVVSESVSASKVKSSKVTLKSAEVSRLVSDDNKAASNPAASKGGKGKARGRVAMFAVADEEDDDKNDEQKAVRKRQYGRRKSVVAVAFAKLRKSIKAPQPNADQSSSEGTLDTRDQMSLILMAMVAGFLLVFMVVLVFIFFVGATAIPDGIACVTEDLVVHTTLLFQQLSLLGLGDDTFMSLRFTHAECLEAKEYLDSLLNDTKNPCTDFYGYVCSSWRSKGGSFHTEATREALFRLNRTLLHLGPITRTEEIRQGMHLLKPIYSGCYTFMSKEIPLKDALEETQTYLDIMQLMRASNFFDVVRFLVRQSLQIGVATLFRIRFFYEDGRPMMYINSGFTITQKIGFIFYGGEYRKTFERVLQLWLNQSDVDDHVDLLRNMDVEVEKIFEKGNDTEVRMSLDRAVRDVVSGVTTENWVTAVRDSLRQGIVVSATDDIITTGYNVYQPAMQKVVTRGLRDAVFYLAANLEAEVLRVTATRSAISANAVSKGHHCLVFTHQCLALTWAYLAARLLAPFGSTGVISNIFKFIREVIDEGNEVFSWMKNTTAIKTVVSKTSLDVIEGEGYNISRVDYTGPQPPLDESDSFLKNLVEAFRHHQLVMVTHPPTRLEMKLSDLEFYNSLTYVPERRSILVPTMYQNQPLFYMSRVPDFFNYGTLAVLIAEILVKDIIGVSGKGPPDGAGDGETQGNHSEALSCLTARRNSLGFGELSRVHAKEQQAFLLALTMSVRLAYYALMKTFLKQAGTVKMFNEYWPAARHVFFARFCLLWCDSNDGPSPITPREKCMLPLYNLQEFHEQYGCKSGVAPFCKV
ncbi:hypothetical protein MRX96_001777 [Rhipicephalus microplus]